MRNKLILFELNEVAPAILEYLNVDPNPYMQKGCGFI